MDWLGLFLTLGGSFIVFYLFTWLVLFPYHHDSMGFFFHLFNKKRQLNTDSQTVLTRFSKKLNLGDVITPIESTQTFMVVEVYPATAKGYEVEDYMLRLVTDDKSQEPETIIFKVGTQWEKVDPSYIKGKSKLRVVSKRKKYYDS